MVLLCSCFLGEARRLEVLLEDDRDDRVEHELDVSGVRCTGDVGEDRLVHILLLLVEH